MKAKTREGEPPVLIDGTMRSGTDPHTYFGLPSSQPAPPGMVRVPIEVPPGVSPGQTIAFETQGSRFHVRVPTGNNPGTVFTAVVPLGPLQQYPYCNLTHGPTFVTMLDNVSVASISASDTDISAPIPFFGLYSNLPNADDFSRAVASAARNEFGYEASSEDMYNLSGILRGMQPKNGYAIKQRIYILKQDSRVDTRHALRELRRELERRHAKGLPLVPTVTVIPKPTPREFCEWRPRFSLACVFKGQLPHIGTVDRQVTLINVLKARLPSTLPEFEIFVLNDVGVQRMQLNFSAFSDTQLFQDRVEGGNGFFAALRHAQVAAAENPLMGFVKVKVPVFKA